MERRSGRLNASGPRAITLAACLALCACGAPVTDTPLERFVDLQQCAQLRLQGHLTLTVGPNQRTGVLLRGSTAALDAVDVSDGAAFTTIASPLHKLEVWLSCPSLTELEFIGAVSADLSSPGWSLDNIGVFGDSSLQLTGLGSEDLTLRASGRGQVQLAALLVDELTVLAAGDSRLVLQGEADAAYYEVSGNSRVDAVAMPSQRVHVQLRGNSRATVQAGAHLSGDVSDEAILRYDGTPDLRVDANRQAALESMAGALDQ